MSRKQNNYKSKLEIDMALILGGAAEYEPEYIQYIQPEKIRKYCPDFKTNSGIYIECKGKWTADDRVKHVLLKEQHPDKRIILVFQNPNVKINKRSKTTYGDWATKNQLEWYDFRNLKLPREIFSDENNKNRGKRTRKSSRGSSHSN